MLWELIQLSDTRVAETVVPEFSLCHGGKMASDSCIRERILRDELFEEPEAIVADKGNRMGEESRGAVKAEPSITRTRVMAGKEHGVVIGVEGADPVGGDKRFRDIRGVVHMDGADRTIRKSEGESSLRQYIG